MNSQENREKSIFEAARLCPKEKRADFVTEACGNDAQLRHRVETLLRAYEEAGEFLESTPAAVSVKALIDVAESVPQAEGPGDRIGRYRLIEKVGEGGCGVVYMAEQEEPVRRRVALKIIKLGMDTKQVVARFEAERQALALMDHPNIAKVLDAGATGTGRPYFVMEMVPGIKLTDFCDQQNLSTEERVKLFIRVCQAVQHAHQKGIIHRDIKPSNILVTSEGGVPVPKVIDFGIAKATSDQRLTDKTLFTAFEQFVGTPAYMSPEQAEKGALDIDTRTDIYSLGVLLYELLTGKTPFDQLALVEAGLDGMRKMIREKEPAPPSTRLGTLGVEEQTTVARKRGSEPPKLIQTIRGDLDWIAMKCLEKDRSRRYPTTSGLAGDLQRHLDNEPVSARPPSRVYRLGKFARRHRGAFASATVIALVLVTGATVSIWQAIRATRAETLAKGEADKRGRVAQFLEEMIGGISPEVAKGRDTSLLREILQNNIARIDKDLSGQPELQAELEATMAAAYWRIGEYEKSATLLRGVAQRLKSIPGNEQSLAQTLNDLAVVLNRQGKSAEAETMHREVLAMRKKLLGPDHEDVGESLNNLAAVLSGQGKSAEAETLDRQALALWRKLKGNEHPLIYTVLNNLAQALADQGKLAEAETTFSEALVIEKKLLGDEHPDVASTLNNLALLYADQGELAKAEATHRQALAVQRKLLNNEHPDLAKSLHNLSRILREEEKLAEAETFAREALAMRKKLLGSDHPDTEESLNSLAEILKSQGKFTEAELFSRECVASREKTSPDDYRTYNARSILGDILFEQHKYAEAEPLLISGFEGMEQRKSRMPASGKARLREILERLVQLYEATGESAKASACRSRLTLLDRAEGETPPPPVQPKGAK
jgi:serine/threonine protein kinase/tetratricopeptide (TPR) repeat protein